MRIEIGGSHYEISSVNIPLCNTKFTKFGEDFFDSETLEDVVRERFESFSTSKDNRGWEQFFVWKMKNEDKAWYDLRENESGSICIVAGDSDNIKFVSIVDYLTLDYEGHEINVYGWRKDYYSFSFFIDPKGGILRASDEERSCLFYDELVSDDAEYSKENFSFKAAIDDLVASSDKYQNSSEEEEKEEK